uniref:BZIP domain-containing protein n=1 Tax=Anopheles minimus TaxID=112268 RepID=A0A182VUE2_9DIPT
MQKDLCYDDKLKLSPNNVSVLPGNYGPPSSAGKDEFYHISSQQSETKSPSCTNGAEMLMEYDCLPSNMEFTNVLTPPTTPPQTTSFGGVVGCVAPIQVPINYLAVSQQQEQPLEQFQPFYATQYNGQGMLQQQQQQEQQVAYQGTNDTILNEYYITDDITTVSSQQQPILTFEPPVSGDIDATVFNFVENYTPQQVENILLGLREPNRDDDESCDYSEVGSFDNGGSLSPASLTSSAVGQSPVYSDSAESSTFYGSCRNDGDDEDWSPSKEKKLSNRNGGAVTKKRSGPNGNAGTTSRGRGIEDKKSRKKEQNKNAATRYRIKKKAEIEEILVVEEQLLAVNKKLRKESKDLG